MKINDNLKMKKIISLLLIVALAGSCEILQQAINMINCKYKLSNITDITWAGINLSNIKSPTDLSFNDAAKAAKAILNKDFRINFKVNVQAVNNATTTAGINGFDYILLLDGSQIATGQSSNKKITVAPNGGKTTIPFLMNVDLKTVLTGKNVENMVNFAKNVSNYGKGQASKVSIKFRPWIKLGDSYQKLTYITLNKTFQ